MLVLIFLLFLLLYFICDLALNFQNQVLRNSPWNSDFNNAINYKTKMFYLEHIYKRFKSNRFEFNLVYGELSVTCNLI